MPPAPKPKDQRVNRAKPKTGEWVILPLRHDIKAPKLPLEHGVKWIKLTKEWWATIWASPMATQWQAADVPGLVEMAMFRQQMFTTERFEERMKLADQVQKRGDKFGLSPKGRKDLRWVITDEDAESAGVKSHLAVVRRMPAR